MSQFKASNKARFWLHISYPENMVDDWEEKAPDLLGVPFAYCIHDKDESGHDGDRKKHVHWITAWERGGQTKKFAWSLLEQLAKPGKQCSLEPRASGNIEHSYMYLIHDTEAAKKAKKHLYSLDERCTFNGFDIDRYITLDTDAKNQMAKELCDFVVDRGYKDMTSAYRGIKAHFDEKYFEIYKANNAMIDRLVRGNYLKWDRKKQEILGYTCAVCGCHEVVGSFWHDNARAWFCSEHQETVYHILEELESEEI